MSPAPACVWKRTTRAGPSWEVLVQRGKERQTQKAWPKESPACCLALKVMRLLHLTTLPPAPGWRLVRVSGMSHVPVPGGGSPLPANHSPQGKVQNGRKARKCSAFRKRVRCHSGLLTGPCPKRALHLKRLFWGSAVLTVAPSGQGCYFLCWGLRSLPALLPPASYHRVVGQIVQVLLFCYSLSAELELNGNLGHWLIYSVSPPHVSAKAAEARARVWGSANGGKAPG